MIRNFRKNYPRNLKNYNTLFKNQPYWYYKMSNGSFWNFSKKVKKRIKAKKEYKYIKYNVQMQTKIKRRIIVANGFLYS